MSLFFVGESRGKKEGRPVDDFGEIYIGNSRLSQYSQFSALFHFLLDNCDLLLTTHPIFRASNCSDCFLRFLCRVSLPDN